MIFIDCLSGIGLLLNTIGSIILVKSTYGFESVSTFASEEMSQQMCNRNIRRNRNQKIGLRLLATGFIVQFTSIVLSIILSIK
jgi:hypothetical protein